MKCFNIHLDIENNLKCNFGKHANDKDWTSELCGETVESLINSLILSVDNNWICEHSKFLPTFMRIIWTNKITGEREEEYYTPTEEEYKNFGLFHNNPGENFCSAVKDGEKYVVSLSFAREKITEEEADSWIRIISQMFNISYIFKFYHNLN